MSKQQNDFKWLPLLAILSAPFLAVLDAFIFNVTLPSIQTNLHADPASLQLIVAGYSLSYASFLTISGKLGDMYGRKKLFLAGMTAFSVASIIGAFSPSAVFLICTRVLEGLGAALMYPQALSLIQVNYQGPKRTIAMSAFGFTLGSAAISAQLIGGSVLQLDPFGLTWRAIYLVKLPIVLMAMPIVVALVQESKSRLPAKPDFLGVGLIFSALFLLILPLTSGREFGWPMWIWPLFALSAASAILFTFRQRASTKKGATPLINFELFKIPQFVVGLLVTLIFYAGQGSFYFVLTLYLQKGLNFSPLAAGVIFTPVALGFFFASTITNQLANRIGKHVLTIGLACMLLSTLALSALALGGNPQDSAASFIPVLFLNGIGVGMIIPPLIGIVLSNIPTDYAGAASGMLLTTQQVSGATGVALIGIIYFGLLQNTSYTNAFAYTIFYNGAIFLTTATLVKFLRR